MKFKNILFAALVAGAGTAVAQNSATLRLPQTGAGNDNSGVTQTRHGQRRDHRYRTGQQQELGHAVRRQ